MRKYNFNSAHIYIHILMFFLFIYNIAADPCKTVNCGQGTCVASSGSLLGFDCLSNPGWNKVQLGPVSFPACTLHNCTINYQCGNGATPALPPPTPTLDLLNPCNVVWCGDGTCISDGLKYSCKCNDGSANILNMTAAACFKECSLGADCKGVTSASPPIIPPPPPSPSNVFGPPPSSSSFPPLAPLSPPPPSNAPPGPSSFSPPPPTAQNDPCKTANCGQGTCVTSSASLLGFDCLCNPGWNKVQLGLISFPACTVPNCTVNYQCGNGATPPPSPPPPPPPPPPPAANFPPLDLLNPCNLVWCGEGKCIPNGLGYSCKCNDGSANLFNMTGVACFNECSLGADCNDITFGSPPMSSTPPPPVSSNVPNCGTSLSQVTMLLLSSIFLACM